MIRGIPPAFGRGLVQLLVLVIGFVLLEIPTRMGLWAPGGLMQEPSRIWLIVSGAACGGRRITRFHPGYDVEYQRWLRLTPWTVRKPLPMGPVVPTWGDGVYMATVILLSATRPEPRSMQLLAFYLIGHLVAILPMLAGVGGAIGYVTVAGLGLVVRLIHTPSACVLTATAVYLVAYEGLRRSLQQSPPIDRLRKSTPENITGDPAVEQLQQLGWPYGRMLAEVRAAEPTSRLDALLLCLLLTWWIDCIAVVLADPKHRMIFLGLVSLPVLAAPFIRLVIYVRGYAPPLTLWGRLRMFKPIVPGYDRVFVGPACALLAGPMTLMLLTALRAPIDVRLSVTYGMVLLVAILTPPSLRRWRLTGGHRMVPTMAQGETQFVRVG